MRHHARDDVSATLLRLAARAVAAGRAVLVLAPDGPSAARWRADAARGCASATVISAREAALATIAGARGALPRQARLLDGNEMDVLLEDLKVSGLKPGRLREMTKFFYKGIADGVSRDADWLISAEEQRIWAIMTENLDARRALLPGEAFAVAADALATPGGAQAAASLADADALVIAPAFNTLSATAQRFVRMLATRTLVAAGTDLDASNAEEDYPNPAGFDALVAEAGTAAVVLEGPCNEQACATAVAAHPAEEFQAVCDAVAAAVDAGTPPHAITVACPNRTWMDAIAGRLAARGIPGAVQDAARKAKGDPREEDRCGRLRTRAAAKLLLDADDFTAWRSWLGLGDWLVRSDAFLELLAWARDHETSAAEAFSTLIAIPDAERGCTLFHKFDEPHARFSALKDQLDGADGPTARAALENAGCALTERERALLDAEAAFDAARFAGRVLGDEATDGDAAADDAVAVVPYRRAFGRHGVLTVICGMVGGFLPALDAVSDRETVDHRRRAYDRDRILFEAAKSSGERIVLTRFTDDRIENADVLSMDVARIYMADGLRMAQVKPSPYLDDYSPVPSLPTVETMVGGLATL